MEKSQKQRHAEFEYIRQSGNVKLMLLWLKQRLYTNSSSKMIDAVIQKELSRHAIYKDELKFCPCCEGKPEILNGQQYTIQCSKCGLTLTGSSEKDAKEKWNRRPQ